MTRRQRCGAIALGTALLTGCGTQDRRHVAVAALVSVTVSGHGVHRVAQLDAARGVRINARLRPALEFRDGSVITFTGEESVSDSGYFAGHPRAALGATRMQTATLRASVCPADRPVCLTVATDVELPR